MNEKYKKKVNVVNVVIRTNDELCSYKYVYIYIYVYYTTVSYNHYIAKLSVNEKNINQDDTHSRTFLNSCTTQRR